MVKRRPTRDEQAADAFIRKVFSKTPVLKGLGIHERQRIYRNLVSTILDLNYSSFMGLRPKLGIRNLGQQWLIINEYGLGNYTRGRFTRFSKDVREAIKESDIYQARKGQYLVFEERMARRRDIPKKVRELALTLYRQADLDNVNVAFATAYKKALAEGLPRDLAIRAGGKAIHNTQWGYGIDLPYLFKTPTGRVVGQYSSWFLWYLDHNVRTVKERHGAKAARTVVQGTLLYYLAERWGIDYLKTFMFGVVPKGLGFLATSMIDTIKFLAAVGTMDAGRIKSAARSLTKIPFGVTPGYLATKDLQRALAGEIERLFIYPREQRRKEGGIEPIAGF